MSLSALGDKSHEPSDTDLREVLGRAYEVWVRLIANVGDRIGALSAVWGFTSKKTGWGLRLRHKERVILYMTPLTGRFLVSFVLGDKAVQAAHRSRLPAALLKTIDAAPRYAEGRGVRLEVSSARQISALVTLAIVKHEN